MRWMLWLAGGLALSAVAFATGYQAYPRSHAPSGSPSNLVGEDDSQLTTSRNLRPAKVVALGRLEPGGGMILLGAMAGDRLASLEARQGDHVKAGQILGTLQSHALRESELKLAEAQLADAQARQRAEVAFGQAQIKEAELAVEQLKSQPLEIRAQEAKAKALEANLKVAQRDVERLQGLDPKLASPQEREHQQLLALRAEQELLAARAQLDQLRATQDLQTQIAAARLETAKASIPRLEAAVQLNSVKQNVELARNQLDQSILRAPSDGSIVDVNVDPGESIGQQPVFEMANTSQMYARAEIYETDLRWIEPGQTATITSPALPTQLTGTVERVGSVIARNTDVGLDPTRSADARVAEVMIRLNQSDVAGNLLQLQVDVEIDVSPRRLADAAR